ncbi:FG-GAP-like repeat-containing protein [Nocardioides sp. DS6]|uniref:FG-GAP-like repeat-containing protein n=1 Tax=Nocardioides eburneus TaxID=3231482 RepID=A0ABV3T4W5_9ACTN
MPRTKGRLRPAATSASRHTRFVATCQQLLVLGVVFAALIPAASIVSLDVVKQSPDASVRASGPAAAMAAYIRAAETPSTVPAAPVDAHVREVALTPATLPQAKAGVSGRTIAPSATTSQATLARPTARTTVVTSDPQRVTGFGVVGVTWSHADQVDPSHVAVQIRTENDGRWSAWKALENDDDGPDPSSAEGKAARPGTIEGLVGHVEQVQARLTATGVAVPADLKLAIVDPGTPSATTSERPAIDTGDAAGDVPASSPPGTTGTTGTTSTAGSAADVSATTASSAGSGSAAGTGEAAAVLAAAAYTPKPQIYSRAQWGANEKIREQTKPSYFEIHGGFVHHTVNANDYTKAEVPGIIRSIYAYHVQSRGWRDIGYNFLIDKFGRIWEGRYGGVARPVVGAHTENYNDYGFGVSAIGNFETAKPTSALIQAEGAIFAWKLSLHGVNANATNVRIGKKVFPHAIEGHRDTKATACPGKYLYARIPDIRTIAASLQKGWSGRELASNIAGTAYPDLIARRAKDGRAMLIRTGGLAGFHAAKTTMTGFSTSTTLVVSPDLTGDGKADLVTITSAGKAATRPGNGKGSFGAAVSSMPKQFVGRTMIAAAGDLDGDGRNDLIGRDTRTGRLVLFHGNGKGAFTARLKYFTLSGYDLLIGTGDVTGDGHPDILGRKGSRLMLFRGDGNGVFHSPVSVASNTYRWSTYTAITGYGDFDNDGKADLLARGSSGRAWILPGDGRGHFGKPQGPYSPTSAAGSWIGAAKVTGGLLPDLLGRSGTSLRLVQNTGRRNLAPATDAGVSLTGYNRIMMAGDWDRDGKGDFIARRTNGDLYLFRGKGGGKFDAPTKLASGFGAVRWPVVAGDITGDGYPDIQGQVNGSVRIYPGNGLKGLQASYVSHSAISASAQIAAGRWNGDGAPDSIFRANNQLTLYPGNGPGGLTSPVSLGINVKAYDVIVGVRDLRNASGSDLIVREKATGDFYALQRLADGKLGTRVYLGPGGKAYDLIG